MDRTGQEQWSAREVARLLSLVETERRYYQEMVASLPAGLVVLRGDRSIVSSNPAFRKVTGLRSDELRGKTIEQLFPSDELIERIRAAHLGGNQEPVRVQAGDRTLRIAIVPSHGWDDEDEPETVLMVEEVTGAGASAGAKPVSPSGVPAIVWRADTATLRFLSVEGAAQELTGYAPFHWTSNPRFFWGRIQAEDLSQVRSTYQTAMEKGGTRPLSSGCARRPVKRFGCAKRFELEWRKKQFPASPPVSVSAGRWRNNTSRPTVWTLFKAWPRAWRMTSTIL